MQTVAVFSFTGEPVAFTGNLLVNRLKAKFNDLQHPAGIHVEGDAGNKKPHHERHKRRNHNVSGACALRVPGKHL